MCCAGVAQCWEVEQACDCERACACPVLVGVSVSWQRGRGKRFSLSLSLSLLSPSSSPLSLDSLLFCSLTLSNSLSASLRFSLSYYYTNSRTLALSFPARQPTSQKQSEPASQSECRKVQRNPDASNPAPKNDALTTQSPTAFTRQINACMHHTLVRVVTHSQSHNLTHSLTNSLTLSLPSLSHIIIVSSSASLTCHVFPNPRFDCLLHRSNQIGRFL